MKMTRLLVLATALAFTCTATAQSNLAELIEQTGIEPGDTPMRDMPGWREPQKIVYTSSVLPLDEVRALLPGVEVIYGSSAANAKDADAIIGSCSSTLVDAAERAIWVQVTSAGVDRCVAVGRIASGAAVLTNMQKMSSPAIAEHVIALSLSLARKIPEFAKQMETGEWYRDAAVSDGMMSIAGKTMLVIGLGGIGTEGEVGFGADCGGGIAGEIVQHGQGADAKKRFGGAGDEVAAGELVEFG